jgi:putative methionine-R-sulfoxide reductase with GAF domain
MTTITVSEEKHNPVLDEQALAKLLEAAYVLQEHNRKMQKPAPPHESPVVPPETREHPTSTAPSEPKSTEPERASKDDYTFILAQIVEAQRQIQLRQLGLEDAMSLVAARLIEMTRADGAAICIVEGEQVRYRAAAGRMALSPGTEVPATKALSAACLRTGQIVRWADVSPEAATNSAECRQRGIHSLIAVPIYHDAGVAGSLELYYAGPRGFTEQDVHTCQLMTGLVTEALARDHELTWKKSLATERAAMLEALEKLKPNLVTLVDTPAVKESAAQSAASTTASTEPAFICRKCGNQLAEEEHFCGKCGSPRSGDYEPPTMQSKVASLLTLQDKTKKGASANGTSAGSGVPVADLLHPAKVDPSSEEELFDSFETSTRRSGEAAERTGITESATAEPGEELGESDLEFPADASLEDEISSPETAIATAPDATQDSTAPAADWSSAASARQFLEQLSAAKPPDALSRFWKARRGDIYLAVAVLLVAGVIRWGIWSDHSVGATGSPAAAAAHHKPAPDADLPLYDRILIKLGLAEAPEPVEYKGNPDTQVWVDLHTALYYCPGADLYGKTPTGKFTTQKDAQLDQFEPAYRKTCN